MKYAAFQNQALSDLLGRLFNSQVPVKTAYKLSRLQKAVTAEAERYEELRIKLVKQFGVKDEVGELVIGENGSVTIPEEGQEEFLAELNSLFEIEFEVPEKISIDDLTKVELSASDVTILDSIGVLSE